MAYKLNKKFPLNFSKDVEKVVKLLSVKHGQKAGLYGSARFKIDTSGDFDFFQEIKLTAALLEGDNLLKEFQEVIRNVLKHKDIFLGDIKSGEIPALRVVDVDINETNYMKKRPSMLKKLKKLYKDGNIDKEEFDESIALLKPNLTEMDLSIVRDAIRFEVIRWSPEDILQGHTSYRKQKINFKDYLFTFSTTKIDIMAWVNGIRYTEITMVYFFTDKNGEQINSGFQYLKEFLSDSIPVLLKKGNYMKICKKINAIERTKDEPDDLILKRIYSLYISNLGRLSQIVSDIKVLIFLIENVKVIPKNKFKYEIDQMKYRLGVVSNKKYLKHQEAVVKLINEIEKDVVDLNLLDQLKDEINDIMQSEVLKQMKKWKLFPIPKEYLPKPDDIRGQGFDKKEEELLHKTLASAIQKGYGDCHMVQHILKGIPTRFLPSEISLKKKDLLREHTKLIDVLTKGTKQQQLKEAADQQKEMAAYE